jgi:ABC-2 type transport system ATP-binding protein
MSKPIIHIQNFSKSFGTRQVINDLSFDVMRGETFAFLGANGSGKTTTIRCLLGIYEPDGGDLLIEGQVYSPETASILGYLPEERGLYVNSKVLETMIYFGQIKGMSYQDAKSKSLKYLERVELADKADVKISKLSSGQQQKIQLGITIINSPELLILDEPTKGLDPVNRSLLLEILRDLNKEGATIIFSTHQMDEAERIADRLVMIKNGKRALYGELGEVKSQFGTNVIRLNFSGKLPANPKLYTAQVQTNYAEITPVADNSTDDVLKFLVEKGVKIAKFEVTSPSLNEIFIQVSKDKNI